MFKEGKICWVDKTWWVILLSLACVITATIMMYHGVDGIDKWENADGVGADLPGNHHWLPQGFDKEGNAIEIFSDPEATNKIRDVFSQSDYTEVPIIVKRKWMWITPLLMAGLFSSIYGLCNLHGAVRTNAFWICATLFVVSVMFIVDAVDLDVTGVNETVDANIMKVGAGLLCTIPATFIAGYYFPSFLDKWAVFGANTKEKKLWKLKEQLKFQRELEAHPTSRLEEQLGIATNKDEYKELKDKRARGIQRGSTAAQLKQQIDELKTEMAGSKNTKYSGNPYPHQHDKACLARSISPGAKTYTASRKASPNRDANAYFQN